jgi:hypothetical protein
LIPKVYIAFKAFEMIKEPANYKPIAQGMTSFQSQAKPNRPNS